MSQYKILCFVLFMLFILYILQYYYRIIQCWNENILSDLQIQYHFFIKYFSKQSLSFMFLTQISNTKK